MRDPVADPRRATFGVAIRALIAGPSVDHLLTIIKNRLKRIQCQPGFLDHTGLTLDLNLA
ncbi:hypothetical protein [Salinispora arenicola]|uniref:hypothetical protein n=1 Tax=Salinispora arenicola TaxID=168697 RepID=UPI00169067FA|nr:hypothetical protein [Salinispora arenicola]NIL64820.1 hypothetical protein [Salinispora arenicola]